MSLYSKIMNYILWKIIFLLKNRTFVIYTNGTKYLQRTYIKHKGIFPEILLHRFYASDSDRHLHNHPWNRSISLILDGSYTEERMTVDDWTKRFKDFSPGKINKISKDDYHRVSLKNELPVWTLFIAGKRVQSWGFWVKGKHVPWQEYTEVNNNVVKDLDGNITKLPE